MHWFITHASSDRLFLLDLLLACVCLLPLPWPSLLRPERSPLGLVAHACSFFAHSSLAIGPRIPMHVPTSIHAPLRALVQAAAAMADEGAANFTREKWDEMIQLLDKDGDGTVDKEEYFLAYKKMFPNLTDEECDAQWTKIDADGDGTLTVLELAQYYGFNLDGETTAEMSDEQILEALQVCVPACGSTLLHTTRHLCPRTVAPHRVCSLSPCSPSRDAPLGSDASCAGGAQRS